MAVRDKYRSTSTLSRTIILLLWVEIAATAASVLATLAFMAHLRAVLADEGPHARLDEYADLVPAEVAQILIGLLVFVLAVTLIVMICRWIYRVAWNVRHLGAKRLEISPGMAVGWYFVPFANLVMPFRAMREIWLASHDPAHWQERRVGLINGWWALWLLSGIVNQIALRAALAADTVQQLHTTEIIGIAGYLLSIGSSLVFIRVIRGVQDAQDLNEAGLGQPTELPPAADSVAVVEA